MKKKSHSTKTDYPGTLSAEAGEWWRKIVGEYAIDDDAGHLLLQSALEAFDRTRNCQKAIKKDGELVKDRFQQLKAHPLLSAERDARAQMLAALKQLNLDVEPLHPGRGRPAGTLGGVKRNAN